MPRWEWGIIHTGDTQHGISNKSRFHVKVCYKLADASAWRIRRTRSLCSIEEEPDIIAEPDQETRCCLWSNEGELQSARRVHAEPCTRRKNQRKGQGLPHVQRRRSRIETYRSKNLRNVHVAQRLNTKRQNRGSTPLLSRNFFNSITKHLYHRTVYTLDWCCCASKRERVRNSPLFYCKFSIHDNTIHHR